LREKSKEIVFRERERQTKLRIKRAGNKGR
jgi:hypothetical protein